MCRAVLVAAIMCATALAYVPAQSLPRARRGHAAARLTVTAKTFHNTGGSGLSLQSRSGAVTRAAQTPPAPRRVVLQAKIDLDEVDWSKADKADAWAQWKNTIYFGSVGLAVLLPVFFLVVKP